MKKIYQSEWLRTPDAFKRGNPDNGTAELLLFIATEQKNVWTAVDVLPDTPGRQPA